MLTFWLFLRINIAVDFKNDTQQVERNKKRGLTIPI